MPLSPRPDPRPFPAPPTPPFSTGSDNRNISPVNFTPANWYWAVANSTTQVFSSAVGDYVPTTDATHQAWLAAGNKPTKIDTESNLGGVLAQYGLRPTPANILTGYQIAKVSAIDKVIFQVLFNHENRIRTLANQPTVTAQQFINAIQSLL